MHGLVTAARWEMMILLGGIMSAVVFKLFTGDIQMSGLLTVKGGKDDGSLSPGRVQMLMVTVLTGMYYLLQIIHSQSTTSLPDIPAPLVGVLGGSQAVYLGGKVQSLLFDKPARGSSK